MAQERPTTPEGQLLKIIEQPQGKEFKQQAVRHKGLRLFTIGAIKSRFVYLKQFFTTGFKKEKFGLVLNIGRINKLLYVVIVFGSIYLGTGIVLSTVNLDKALDINITIDKELEGIIEDKGINLVLKKLSYYMERPKGRDIFKFVEKTKLTKESLPILFEPEKEEEKVSKIQEMINDLRLVGISWSDDPDAMVENTKTKTTYFLKKGQKIEGKIRVEAIFINKLVLSYEGEEAELK